MMSFAERKRARVLRRKEKRLVYAATARCRCGAGLAYRSSDTAWDCSNILLGIAIPSGRPGAVTHDDVYPFIFYKLTSERQSSAKGATTRP